MHADGFDKHVVKEHQQGAFTQICRDGVSGKVVELGVDLSQYQVANLDLIS